MSEKRPRKRGGAKAPQSLLAIALIGLAVVAAPAGTESAKANGDTRTIYFHHAHTHESMTATYMVDGQYDPAVLEKLNWFLRDWRREQATHMDPHLFDVIWEVYRESGSSQPIEVMSAYRSPETNAMLRRRSRAVAEHSQHILGKAMDQHYVDVPMSRIREIAMKLQRGGVGFYPSAGTPFVHMDVGGVRHWPRMSYDQLARLFPDGKTVHIPANGQPLPGYEEARAELEARGDSFSYPTATEVKSKGFFAWLFGGSDADEDAAAAGGGGSRHDRGAARQRVASLDRSSAGSAPQGNSFGMDSRDAGMRAFTASAAAPPSSSYGTISRRPPVHAPPAPQPAPEPAVAEQPSPDTDAQAKRQLAEAMAKEQVPATSLPASAPAEIPVRAADATAPLPPRRPIELAFAGPSAPLPPGRPVEFASLLPNKPGRPGLPGGATPTSAPQLPAVITQGAGGTKPPAVLAYAAPPPIPLPPSPPASIAAPSARVAVPLPLPRPNFVAARLDRSNFRSLTGSGVAARMPVRSGLGSAVMALRPAARLKFSLLSDKPASDATQDFNAQPSPLTVDRFSGPAVMPREHVVNSDPGAAAGGN
ncbi:MAG TPA: DUF882 domain-containing protein [Lichenihabitans sp.]|nr:DUF882 domain-containing protein [Lichenihabitans sp.]